MISLDKVTKSYDGGHTHAVKEVSLEVEPGELLVILGTSGCGKTTTLKMINRLVELTSGRIVFDGEDTANLDPVALRRRIGYVFQGIGLFPHLTVGENIASVPKLLGWSRNAIRERVDELLELTHLNAEEYRDRLPANLSGGQRQRVGLARALAARPRVMLMDEPLGALDPITRDSLQGEYMKIHRDLELTTVMVTHDMVEALLMADRIVAMDEGEIIEVGTPHELFSGSAQDYVKQLMETPRKQTARLREIEEEKDTAERGEGRG